MRFEIRVKDSFIIGLISGFISLFVIYFVLTFLRSKLISYSGNPFILRPPQVQLITMLINVIIFRILIINFDKEKTGKGFLFITVIATLVYFLFFFRMKN